MSTPYYADHVHLLAHAKAIFPGSTISITHTDDEVIHIDVDGVRYTFEIGSDDEEYVFTKGNDTFRIPLMDKLP
jgi:hypothetical protein